MADSDQIKKLKERNERLQKQLDGSKKKVSDLQDKLKRTRAPPPLPKDAPAEKEDGKLEKKVAELTEKLEKATKELQDARRERDEFAQQLRTLREKLIAAGEGAAAEKSEEEPEYDPETKKYKLSWVGDSLEGAGKKKEAGLDKRTTEEKMKAMAAEKQALEKKKAAKAAEKKKPDEKKEKDEEELEETESYSVEELLERAEHGEDSMDFEALKDLKDGGSKPIDGPTVPGVSLEEVSSDKPKKRDPDDSDVALVTSESGGRPVLRMHEVPDDEVAEPTFKEEESLVTESREEEITDKRTEEEVKEAFVDDDSEVMTEEKPMVHVPPPPAETSEPLFARVKKVLSDNRALILKTLLFLAGAGLGVGLALLIFLGPDGDEPAGGEDQADEKAVEEPVEKAAVKVDAPKPKKKAAAETGAEPKSERAPAELVEPIYKDAAIMDKKEAAKIGAALKVFVDKYPKDPLLRYHYARSLYHKGEVQAAIAQLEETMKLDPDMPEVHYMLGGIYLRMGDEQKAHEALDNFTRLTGKSGK
jgi:hypothetical protein